MWLVIAILLISVHIYTVIDVARTSAGRVHALPKRLWAITALIPLIGPILWLLFGQQNALILENRKYPGRPSKSQNQTAPDDDPEFLRILEIQKHQREEAKRLEQWRKNLQQREQEINKNDNQNDDGTQDS